MAGLSFFEANIVEELSSDEDIRVIGGYTYRKRGVSDHYFPAGPFRKTVQGGVSAKTALILALEACDLRKKKNLLEVSCFDGPCASKVLMCRWCFSFTSP